MNLDSNSEIGIGAPNKYPCAEGHPIEVRSAACSSFSMPSAMTSTGSFFAHLNYMLDDRLIRCSETQCLNQTAVKFRTSKSMWVRMDKFVYFVPKSSRAIVNPACRSWWLSVRRTSQSFSSIVSVIQFGSKKVKFGKCVPVQAGRKDFFFHQCNSRKLMEIGNVLCPSCCPAPGEDGTTCSKTNRSI